VINFNSSAVCSLGGGVVGVIYLPMIAAFRHIFSANGKYTDGLFCI